MISDLQLPEATLKTVEEHRKWQPPPQRSHSQDLRPPRQETFRIQDLHLVVLTSKRLPCHLGRYSSWNWCWQCPGSSLPAKSPSSSSSQFWRYFDLVKDKMEKVLRGSKGFSARLRLAADGVVGCATVTAVVKHLFWQCNVLQSMQSTVTAG